MDRNTTDNAEKEVTRIKKRTIQRNTMAASRKYRRYLLLLFVFVLPGAAYFLMRYSQGPSLRMTTVHQPVHRLIADDSLQRLVCLTESDVHLLDQRSLAIISSISIMAPVDAFIIDHPSFRYVIIQQDGVVRYLGQDFRSSHVVQLHCDNIVRASISTTGDRIAVTTRGYPSRLQVTDLPSNRIIFDSPQYNVDTYSFSSSATTLLTSGVDRGLEILDLRTGKSVSLGATVPSTWGAIERVRDEQWVIVANCHIYVVTPNSVEHGLVSSVEILDRANLIRSKPNRQDRSIAIFLHYDGKALMLETTNLEPTIIRVIPTEEPTAFCISPVQHCVYLAYPNGKIISLPVQQ